MFLLNAKLTCQLCDNFFLQACRELQGLGTFREVELGCRVEEVEEVEGVN